MESHSHTNQNEVDKGAQDVSMDIRPSGGCYVKTRHVLAIMTFLSMCTLQIMRICVNVAVVAMVNFTDDKSTNNSASCSITQEVEISSATGGEFSWSKTQVGVLLASYYYGYPITNLVGGYLGNRFGPRIVVGIAMMSAAVLTSLCPLAARMGFVYLVITRALLGFSQGPCSPGMTCLWSKWAPPFERSFMMSITLAGTNFGSTAIMPIAAVIADNYGWEAVFYFSGGVAAAFSIAFFCIVYDSPEDHPRISDEEKYFITNAIRGKMIEKSERDNEHWVPWCAISTSLPVWAMSIAVSASNWGDYVVLALLPSYMTIVLGCNLSTMGVLGSLPFMINFIFMIGSGYLTDVIGKKRIANTTVIRKVNTVLGLVVPALFLVLAVNVGCDVTTAITFFTISVGFAAFTAPGAKANPLDIAPPYSGILWGIACALANVSGLASIQLAGWMLDIDDSISQWKHVFWVAAIVYCGGAVIFLIFGTGVQQPWSFDSSPEQGKAKKDQCESEMTPLEV